MKLIDLLLNYISGKEMPKFIVFDDIVFEYYSNAIDYRYIYKDHDTGLYLFRDYSVNLTENFKEI